MGHSPNWDLLHPEILPRRRRKLVRYILDDFPRPSPNEAATRGKHCDNGPTTPWPPGDCAIPAPGAHRRQPNIFRNGNEHRALVLSRFPPPVSSQHLSHLASGCYLGGGRSHGMLRRTIADSASGTSATTPMNPRRVDASAARRQGQAHSFAAFLRT
ncbi:hypothetical protein GQ53DRAFT_756079 [Thozetella sp. PMI_491]|nr:hypothetical protein GQ53DRAFT_756079 [Thozetella sp. PMI_491]